MTKFKNHRHLLLRQKTSPKFLERRKKRVSFDILEIVSGRKIPFFRKTIRFVWTFEHSWVKRPPRKDLVPALVGIQTTFICFELKKEVFQSDQISCFPQKVEPKHT